VKFRDGLAATDGGSRTPELYVGHEDKHHAPNNAEDGQNKSEALSMKVNDDSVVQGMLPEGFLELVLDFAANF
jgi:hypothetical protein